MCWYCPTCCVDLSNVCRETPFHKWHGDAALLAAYSRAGTESPDTRSAAAAALPLQNSCVKITWGTVQELKSGMVIASPHSSASEFLNHVPSEACMSKLKKAEIILACVQNASVI